MPTLKKEPWNSLGLLILRLGVGGYMLTHGWPKFRMLLDGNFAIVGDPIGIGATASSVLIVFAEFVCAAMVVVGLLTRLAAAPLVIAMLVAALVAHSKDPWTVGEAYRLFSEGRTQFPASKQGALLYAIAFAALALTGPGMISLDHMLWNRSRKPRS
jgi:putative oxidoreductase